jgi:hypothetical protein
MALTPSSLSVAIQGFADFLDGTFDNDVVVTVDSPQKAGKPGDNNSKHTLNIFPYRIAPSGVHPDAGKKDPFFIRAYVLLTAFPASAGNAATDADLQVLGHALRALQSNPEIPVTLPTPIPNNAPASDFRHGPFLSYRLQAILQAPTMEEMNHIWTTQGSELGYRLSVAYELALIPIEPLEHATVAQPVQTGEVVVSASPQPLPFIMFIEGGRLFNDRTIPPGPKVTLALAGDPGPDDDRHANIVVDWTRANGDPDPQAPQTFKLKTVDLTRPEVEITVTLDAAADGDTARISAFPATAAGVPLPNGRPSNLLFLRIEV